MKKMEPHTKFKFQANIVEKSLENVEKEKTFL